MEWLTPTCLKNSQLKIPSWTWSHLRAFPQSSVHSLHFAGMLTEALSTARVNTHSCQTMLEKR